ncbi:MAG: RodZ domain-containing protein [Armatimonadota bacterium]
MESIGEALKARRAEKGFSLKDVFEATKITMQNLAALEENRFDAFANKVYARAFLRDYANFLGLDSTEMLQNYESEWVTSTPVPVVQKKRSPVAAVIIVVLLLAGLGAGAYYYYPKYVNSMDKKPAATPVTQKPEPKPDVKPTPVTAPNGTAAKPKPGNNQVNPAVPVANGAIPTSQPGKPAANGTDKPAQPAKKPAPAVLPGQVRVELTARQDVWVHIKTDGETAIIKTLKAGEKAAVAGKVVSVRAGSSGALDVTVNGKKLGKFGPAGQPTTRTFKP